MKVIGTEEPNVKFNPLNHISQCVILISSITSEGAEKDENDSRCKKSINTKYL